MAEADMTWDVAMVMLDRMLDQKDPLMRVQRRSQIRAVRAAIDRVGQLEALLAVAAKLARLAKYASFAGEHTAEEATDCVLELRTCLGRLGLDSRWEIPVGEKHIASV